MKKIQHKILTSGVALAMVAAPLSVPPATASEQPLTHAVLGAPTEITPELLAKAFAELEESDVPRINNGDGSTTFHLKEGLNLTLPEPHSFHAGRGDAELEPLVSGGRRDGGFWIEFNSFEQNLLIGGTGWALGTALCAIPGVGNYACLFIGLIITAAGSWISAHGTCPGRLHLDVTKFGRIERGYCV